MNKSHKFRVLFVCVGNACRSPMAEAIARAYASDIISALSAGVYPLGEVVPETKDALQRSGISSGGLESKGLHHCVTEQVDLIINMSGMEFSHFPATVPVEIWSVEDPYGQGPDVYQRILEEIRANVLDLAERLRTRTQSLH